jgi:phosphoglycerate dehydrogenase-like enzyme
VLHGQTLGIWGYGKIGRLVAGYGQAFGMKILVWGGENSRKATLEHGYLAAATRAEFFRDADIVSLHLCLHPDTRGIVTLDDLRAMKASALLVNTSRAELIVPGALETALEEGRPGFAALDVYPQEPVLDPTFPLLQRANVLCTPHLGYVEKTAMSCTLARRSRTSSIFARDSQGISPIRMRWIDSSRSQSNRAARYVVAPLERRHFQFEQGVAGQFQFL